MLHFAPASRGEDEFALFRGGPAADLVGRSETEVSSGAPSDVHATLEPKRLDVHGGKGPIPIVVRTELEDAAPGTVVALVVDGTIVGTYRPTSDHKARFVVPEAALHKGRNDLALVTVTGSRGAETLHPVSPG